MGYQTNPPVGSGYDTPNEWSWMGMIGFAALLLCLLGTYHLMQGLLALTHPDSFTAREADLLVLQSYSAWGWAHVLGGIVLMVAAVCLFGGLWWARAVGVLVAVGSAITNLVSITAHPMWSVVMVGLNVLVIMALTVHGRDMDL